MARGLSLHIGLNSIDPAHYGDEGPLEGCENDARAMRRIAKSCGFSPAMLLTKKATSDAVIKAIRGAAAKLRPGDLFLLTYAGHGGQVPDENGDEAENGDTDGRDETWCLYDRMLVDDELYALWGRFEAGVRIAVFSDSCHSGTVIRAIGFDPADLRESGREMIHPGKPRQISKAIADRTWRAHRTTYSRIQKENPQGERAPVGASVILISGCQDNQYAGDGDENGAFTTALLRIWDDGSFTGSYRHFRNTIARLLPNTQSPNFDLAGARDVVFERQRPFTI